MKKIVLWGTTLLIIVTVNFLILRKEDTIKNGRTMLLKLAPVDPRSLMQGDYMVLRYAIARELFKTALKDKGYIVVSLDENNVAQFKRFYQQEDLASGEYLLFYRNRGDLWLGAESFMFEEGKSKFYAKAKYGELKVDQSGVSVLVGLRDEDFKPLKS